MSTDTEETAAAESTPAASAPEATPVLTPFNGDNLAPIYANFARVTGSPEELVMDFGLNPQPFGDHSIPVQVSQRLVMNYYTAKRLWAAVGMALQRHEQAFGVLETDVNKRVLPASQRR